MRKLVVFTVGFGAACCLCAYLLQAEWMSRSTIFTAMLSVMLLLLDRNFKGAKRIALLFLGCTLGFLWYSCFQVRVLEPAARLDGEIHTVAIRTTDYSKQTNYGSEAEGTLRLNDRNYRVLVYLDSPEPVDTGTEITGPFRFRFTAPQSDPVTWYSGNNIFLIAEQQEELILEPAIEPSWQDHIATLRSTICQVVKTAFPEDVFPFAQALLLGDTSALDYQTDTDFKISGIRHVIAVSGLHVSILIGLLSTVTFRRRILMVPLGLGALMVFSALAGFTPSVVRACIMSALMLLAMTVNREYDGPTALAFSVLAMLLKNPLVIASVSFQLSVASVAGIYLFSGKIRKWIHLCLCLDGENSIWKRIVGKLTLSVSVTLSATVLTTPLCACYFGVISLVGVISNLLVLWVISGIFYGIMAVCLIHFIWPSGAVLLASVVSWIVRYVLAVAGFMADLPLAAVYTDSIYIVFFLVFVYVLLAVFYFGKIGSLGKILCYCTLGFCIALTASWMQFSGNRAGITVLDVGQGQCILLRSEGRTYMVDCGGRSDGYAADRAAGYLLSRGIRRLDGMILTHMDDDHAGGADEVLTRVDTQLLILPPCNEPFSANTTVYASEDISISYGNTVITVYAPTFPGSDNEKSLCVLFETENCAILITGDRNGFGERMLLRTADIPDVDILMAGHHGSAGSTCEALLQAVKPEVVCISAGQNNSFGHPAPSLLERLNRYGCTVYRTDIHGTITIRR